MSNEINFNKIIIKLNGFYKDINLIKIKIINKIK